MDAIELRRSEKDSRMTWVQGAGQWLHLLRWYHCRSFGATIRRAMLPGPPTWPLFQADHLVLVITYSGYINDWQHFARFF